MKKLSLYILTLLLSLNLLGQEAWKQWDPEVVKIANTAVDIDYLSDEEKKVILLSNLARHDGLLFANSFLDEFLQNKRPTGYTRSLYRNLKKVKDLPMLQSEKDLYEIAKGHAEISGKRGTTGHQRFDKRFNPVMGKYNSVAENCAYGYSEAMNIVLELLIDEGISSLGHRKNILNPDYNSIGVSIKNHKSYRHNCVMDFGRKQ